MRKHKHPRKPANPITHRAKRPERGNTMKTIEKTTSTAATDERNTTTEKDVKTRREALIENIRFSLDRLTCEELERVKAYIGRLW